MRIACFLLFMSFFCIDVVISSLVNTKRYACIDHKCLPTSNTAELSLSLSTCLTTCDLMLWPYPTGQCTVDINPVALDINKISFNNIATGKLGDMLKITTSNFLAVIKSLRSTKHNENTKLSLGDIKIDVAIADVSIAQFTLGIDESYQLSSTASDSGLFISIKASTYYGARHAFETLSQLFSWDSVQMTHFISSSIHIEDKPTFSYRGIMLDLSRHYLPMSIIQKTVDAMSFNKMNVLHLHLSDTASFPVVLKSQLNLSYYGAYSEEEVYSTDDLAELVSYANARGVMVLPELDGPAHVAAGFQWGASAGVGELVLCSAASEGQPDWTTSALEPPGGQINLANENIYPILKDVYSELADVFAASGYFHVGDDEVIVGSDSAWASCYNSSTKGAAIISYLESRGWSRSDPEAFFSLWQNYTHRVGDMVQQSYAHNFKKMHIWGGSGAGSEVTYNLMPRDDVTEVLPPALYNIQVWDSSHGSIVPELINKGYQVILSNTDYVYLDCGNAGFTNPGGYWCQPYHEWQHIYQYITDVTKLWRLTEQQLKSVLGSETLIWGEMVDQVNVQQKLWPRSAALAEALWSHTSAPGTTSASTSTSTSSASSSSPSSDSWYAADQRLQHWRSVLVKRGVAAEALQPQWCLQQGSNYPCTINQGTPQ